VTNAETILAAFAVDEEVTNTEICRRTGLSITMVATYTARMRADGRLEYVDAGARPVAHRLAGAALARAQMLASAAAAMPDRPAESIVGHAMRTQAPSVFHLGRFA